MKITDGIQTSQAAEDGVTHRTSDPAVVAAWKAKHAHSEKTDIMQQLAIACGLGVKLVQHWLREDRLNPAAIEFFNTCGHCYTHEISGYFLSGTVLEDWYANDWRGKKGQAPTAPQLFERGLMVHSRLELEREAQAYRAPVAARLSAIDMLPVLQRPPDRVDYDEVI